MCVRGGGIQTGVDGDQGVRIRYYVSCLGRRGFNGEGWMRTCIGGDVDQ